MESSYDTIKARLKTILQSERTIEFLNKLTDFGLSIGCYVHTQFYLALYMCVFIFGFPCGYF